MAHLLTVSQFPYYVHKDKIPKADKKTASYHYLFAGALNSHLQVPAMSLEILSSPNIFLFFVSTTEEYLKINHTNCSVVI